MLNLLLGIFLIYFIIGTFWFLWLYLNLKERVKRIDSLEKSPEQVLERVVFKGALKGHISHFWRIVFTWPFLVFKTMAYISLPAEDKQYLLQKRMTSIVDFERATNEEVSEELNALGNSVISNATVSETEDKGA